MPHPSTDGHTLTWPVGHLQSVLQAECGALVDVILLRAHAHGYTDQTSSMRAAWTAAAECIHQCLASYLGDPRRQFGVDGRYNYHSDPHFSMLRDTAQRHYDTGVSLTMHHGLIQLYRRVYREHFSELLGLTPGERTLRPCPLHDPAEFMAHLDDVFDKVELVAMSPWATNSPRDAAMADSVRRLTRERDQYFAALESLRNPIFITGDGGQLITANRAALQAFLDQSEAGALTYLPVLQPHRQELQRIVDEILDTEESQCHAIWMQTRDGLRCFDILVRQVEDTVEKLDHWHVILMHDVTEHGLAVRQARDAERAMSLFMAAMSHEIRVPLHSVLGAASLVKDASPGDLQTLVDLLDTSARSLNATLDNVLNFSRFEHQAPQPCPELVSLPVMLHDLLRVKEIFARQQCIPLRLDIAPDVPQTVLLDWSMTQQILGNLLQNAMRHDDGRGVAVSLRVDGGALVFQVADHGPGLQDDVRDMLAGTPAPLRPRTTGMNGAGLGLAISQRMTLALGGSLAALPGMEGTRIELRLPLHLPVDPSASVPDAMPGVGLRQLECLLLDDDPINALVTIAMLERMGLSVDHAANLGQAHALCQADPRAYEVFIIDYQLPDGNGADFARYLRRDPSRRDTPIFLLSANAQWIRRSPEDVALFTALLEKPLDAASLARAIHRGTSQPASAGFLEGISAAGRHKMAQAFLQGWNELRQRLDMSDAAVCNPDIARRAHKLVSGAAIFGLHGMAQALRQAEQAHTDPGAAAQRVAAHDALLSSKLPDDWIEHAGGAQA